MEVQLELERLRLERESDCYGEKEGEANQAGVALFKKGALICPNLLIEKMIYRIIFYRLRYMLQLQTGFTQIGHLTKKLYVYSGFLQEDRLDYGRVKSALLQRYILIEQARVSPTI